MSDRLPEDLQGKYVPISSHLKKRETLTIRQVKDYLNNVPDELLNNQAMVSDGTAFGGLKSVGFYTNGELFFRGGS